MPPRMAPTKRRENPAPRGGSYEYLAAPACAIITGCHDWAESVTTILRDRLVARLYHSGPCTLPCPGILLSQQRSVLRHWILQPDWPVHADDRWQLGNRSALPDRGSSGICHAREAHTTPLRERALPPAAHSLYVCFADADPAAELSHHPHVSWGDRQDTRSLWMESAVRRFSGDVLSLVCRRILRVSYPLHAAI